MSYTVTVSREDDSWLASVEGVEGAHTFASTLAKLNANIREVIALAEDLPEGAESGLELEWMFDTDDPFTAKAWEIHVRRERVQRELKQVESDTAAMVSSLRGGGISQRDQAFLLGVSPGRVGQLAAGMA